MFHLAVLRDNVRVAPINFGKEFRQAILDELNGKYCNKIVENLGLCINVFDLAEIDDPVIYPSEGGTFIKVKFRLIVFRPFVGEVLVGKIKSSDEDGVRISLTFFDDIFIPASCLQPNSTFDSSERVWVWNYDGNSLFMDTDEFVRFRVLADAFVDVPPVEKDLLLSVNTSVASENSIKEFSRKVSPYTITASIAEDGLGLLSWWGSA